MRDTYQNKYFSILGDSVSTLEGYSVPREAAYYDTEKKLASGVLIPADTWWGKVIARLGGRLLVNNAFAGSTVCRHPLFEIPSYACSDERTSALGRDGLLPDVILVYMGTNDWGRGTPILPDGQMPQSADGTAPFAVAYRTMLQKLKKNYPNAEIWCLTPARSFCAEREDFHFPYAVGGRHITAYCDAIRDCARAQGCRVIDLYRLAPPFDTVDGFHPKASGMQVIADAVMTALEEDTCG